MRRLVAALWRRIRTLALRVVVDAVTDGDASRLQRLQVIAFGDETLEGRDRMGEYGLASMPFRGAEAIVLAIGGSQDHGVAVAVDDRRHRPTDLADGEVALYTDEGSAVVLRRSRLLELLATTLDAQVDADATIDAAGNATLKAALAALLEGTATAKVTSTATTVEGTVTVLVNGAAVTISSSGTIAINASGAVTVTGGSITLGGIDWGAHKHEMPPGSGNYTGPPE